MLLTVLVGCPLVTRHDFPESREWSHMVDQSRPRYTPQWTADGAHIVFGGIRVVNSDGSDLRRLFEYDDRREGDHSPSISPDGTRIAYATSRLKTSGFLRNFEIETSALDGSDRIRLTENSYMDLSPAWSPDGSRIAFLAINYPILDHIDNGIYTMAPDGSDVRLVVEFDSIEWESLQQAYYSISSFYSSGPVWSPDGGKLAFIIRHRFVDQQELVHHYGLYTVAADGSGLTRVFPRTGPNGIVHLSPPAWSPDGS